MTERNVWFVNNAGSRWIGGGETSRNKWSDEMVRRGYGVVWYCPESSERASIGNDVPIPDGIEVRELAQNKNVLKPFPSLNGILRFVEECKRERPERVIFNGHGISMMPLIFAVNAIGYADKSIQVFHGHPSPVITTENKIKKRMVEMLRGVNERAIGILNNNGGRVVTVSNWVGAEVKKRGICSDPTTIYPPVSTPNNCRPELRDNTDRLRVLTVSRIVKEKGIDFLPELARSLRQERLPVEMSLVGSATDPEYLRLTLERMSGLVNYRGHRTGLELCRAYNEADVTVMPSKLEGFGLVTVESLKHGAPVVARNETAREIFGTQEPGLVTSGVGEIGQILAYLGKLLDQQGYLREQSEVAFEVGRKFDPERAVNEFVDFVFS